MPGLLLYRDGGSLTQTLVCGRLPVHCANVDILEDCQEGDRALQQVLDADGNLLSRRGGILKQSALHHHHPSIHPH